MFVNRFICLFVLLVVFIDIVLVSADSSEIDNSSETTTTTISSTISNRNTNTRRPNRQITVGLKVENQEFDVTFPPDIITSVDIANRICQEKFNLIDDTRCIQPIAVYLQNAINKDNERISLKTAVNVLGKSFDITYRPDITNAQIMARRLCVENAETLLLTEENINETCITPLQQTLESVETQFIAERSINMRIILNEKPFTLSFRMDLVTSSEVANNLCITRAEEIGITQENLSECIRLTSSYIENQIALWLDRRAIKMPIVINDIQFDVKLQPNLEAAIEIGNAICKDTSINIPNEKVDGCIRDVVTYIRTTYTNAITRQLEETRESQENIVSIDSNGDTRSLDESTSNEVNIELVEDNSSVDVIEL